MNTDFVSKQTPRGGAVDDTVPRPSDKPLQVEGAGPEVMMEPLHEEDPVKRRQGVADAMRDTDVQYAETTAADMKK